MAINEKDFDKNIKNAVYEALNGERSPFSEIANKELEVARKAIEQADKIKSSTDSKYTAMTPAALENAARERAAEAATGKITDDLRTARVAGDDKSNVIEFMLGMAFGGSGGIIPMIAKVMKGESPFFQTIKDSFSGGKKEGSFTDRWKENVQVAAINKYAKENGLSNNDLMAVLSKADGGDTQLAKVQEQQPSKDGVQQGTELDQKIAMVRKMATEEARLKFEAEESAKAERARLEKERSGERQAQGKANDEQHNDSGKDKKNGKHTNTSTSIGDATDALRGVVGTVSTANHGDTPPPSVPLAASGTRSIT
jgi:hypothetical protein